MSMLFLVRVPQPCQALYRLRPQMQALAPRVVLFLWDLARPTENLAALFLLALVQRPLVPVAQFKLKLVQVQAVLAAP